LKILAAVAHAPGQDFALTELELDAPRDDEILVRIVAVGLCHTDLAFRDQPMGLALPAVLGHEGAGIVERVGAGIGKVAPGDRVLLTFRSCGGCARCAAHHPANCHHLMPMNFSGRRLDGSSAIAGGRVSSNFFGQSSFASHALAYERNVVKLPDDADLALYAPLGCGVQTGAGAVLRALDCRPGAAIAIIGAGSVGLSAVLAARVRGCGPVIVIEPTASRRALALDLGATHAIDPFAQDVAGAVRGIVPMGVEYVVDASGVVPAIGAALGYLAPGGVLGLVGMAAEAAAALPAPLNLLIGLGLSVKGIIEGDSEPDVFIPDLVRLHQAGLFGFDRFVTTYPFARINQAVADQHEGSVVKAVLLMPA
jgi:aryl-alcohol dehydrogenase